MSQEYSSGRAQEARPSRENGDDSLPKFTPGEWYVYIDEDSNAIAVSAHSTGPNGGWVGRHISRMPIPDVRQKRSWSEINANARLMASAPELYAALHCLLEDPRFVVAVGGNPVAVDDLLAKGRAALAKARGVR